MILLLLALLTSLFISWLMKILLRIWGWQSSNAFQLVIRLSLISIKIQPVFKSAMFLSVLYAYFILYRPLWVMCLHFLAHNQYIYFVLSDWLFPRMTSSATEKKRWKSWKLSRDTKAAAFVWKCSKNRAATDFALPNLVFRSSFFSRSAR